MTWSAPDFDTNAANALALRARHAALAGGTGHMRKAEQGSEMTSLMTLNMILNAEMPSLASAVRPTFSSVVTDSFEEFAELVNMGGAQASLVDSSGNWAPGAYGGVTGGADARGLNEGGIEIRQLMDKGLAGGGAFYPAAVALTTGTIDEATIDSIAALWGGNAMLDPMMTPRAGSSNYTYAMGYYATARTHLIAAKAYAADSACTAQRDDAIRAFFRTWELAMFARATFYANFASTGLASMDYADKVDAVHELSEGIGMVLGFRGMENPASGPLASGARVATDTQIDAILSALHVNPSDLGASTVGDFFEAGSMYPQAVTTVEGIVGEAFGLTPAEVQAFHMPTAG